MVNEQGKKLTLMWIIANTVGASGAWICYVVLVNTIDVGIVTKFPGLLHQNVYIYSAVNGVIIGIAQGFALSPLVNPVAWILATTAAWLIGFPASVITLSHLVFSQSFILFAPVSGCVLGLSMGVFQGSVLLFNYRFIKAKNWILVNFWSLGFTYILLLRSPKQMNPGDLDQQTVATFTAAVFGLIYGGITASVLVKLLQPPRD